MPEVSKVRTPLTVGEAQSHIANAWRARFGVDITPPVLALVMALGDLETATFRQLFNNNYGNMIATRDAQQFYRALDSGNPRKFRAFPDAAAGAAALVAQLTSNTRPEWHAGLLTGDPVEYSKALKGLNGGPAYYEAPLERYTAGLVDRWKSYAPTLVDGEPPAVPLPKANPRARGVPVLMTVGATLLLTYLLSRTASGARRVSLRFS